MRSNYARLKIKKMGKAYKKKYTGAYRIDKRSGYEVLAEAIVNSAIEDIKACSRNEILRYEDIGYRIKMRGLPLKFYYYMDAKTFLLGERITGITELDGKDIYLLLLKEKGLYYDGKRISKRI